MMTLLDDFRAQHKLEGVQIVSLMLPTIPKEVLRRSGVDQLIFTVSHPQFLFSLRFDSCRLRSHSKHVSLTFRTQKHLPSFV